MRVVIATAMMAVLLVGQPMVAAHAAPPAGLSVSIRGDSQQVSSGDRVAYTATVKNDGTDAVDGRLVITVPEYVTVADAGGAESSGVDSAWVVSVPAGGVVTESLTGVVGDIPKGEVRVTTLVSLYLGSDAQPAVRSADAATIAGVKDPAHAVNDPVREASGLQLPPIVWVGAVIVAVVLAGLVSWWVTWRRLNRKRQLALPASHRRG